MTRAFASGQREAQLVLALVGIGFVWLGVFASSQASYVAPAYAHPITGVCVTIIGFELILRMDKAAPSSHWVRWLAWGAIAVTLSEILSGLLTGEQFLSDLINQRFSEQAWSRGEMGLDTAIVTFVTLLAQKFRRRRAFLLMVAWAVSSWILIVTGLGKLTYLPMFGGKMSDLTLAALAMMQAAILVMMARKSPFKVILARSATGRNVRWILIGGFISTSLAVATSYQVGAMTGNYSARDLSMTMVALSAVAAANLVLVLWLGAYAQLAALHNERNRRHIAFQRDHDLLTGLLNRRAGTEIVEKKIRAASQGQLLLAIALLDIDHFKDVNDRFGHQSGDQVLMQVARILKAYVRNRDTLIRWGGEEFLLCMKLKEGEDAVTYTDALRVRLEEMPILLRASQGHLRITVSIGVTELTVEDRTLKQVLSRADAALLQAKETGRNRVILASWAAPGTA